MYSWSIEDYESLEGNYYTLCFDFSYNPEGFLQCDSFDIIYEDTGVSVKRPTKEFSNVPIVIEKWLDNEYFINGINYEENYKEELFERINGDRLDED